MLSRATVEGDEVFPKDVEADQVGASDVAAGGSAVRVGIPKKVLISPQVVVSIPVMVWLVGFRRSCWS